MVEEEEVPGGDERGKGRKRKGRNEGGDGGEEEAEKNKAR